MQELQNAKKQDGDDFFDITNLNVGHSGSFEALLNRYCGTSYPNVQNYLDSKFKDYTVNKIPEPEHVKVESPYLSTQKPPSYVPNISPIVESLDLLDQTADER